MKRWKLWASLIGIGLVGIYIADFYFERWIHYKFSYQSQVEATIREKVKASCLN